jgi:ferrochelatase
MEVIYDLDVEAAGTARDLGLPIARAATPGTDPGFVAMISALTAGFASNPPAQAAAALGPDAVHFCGERCCGVAPRRPASRAAAAS